MSILDIVRASGGKDVEIPTLELTCPAWANSLFICGGFRDETFTLEDGRIATFTATGLDVTLPKKSNEAGQQLTVAIDNVIGIAQLHIDQAKEAQAVITLIYRSFLDSDRSAPAERPLRMSVLSASIEGPTVQFTAGYFDLINTAWPRRRYTAQFAPGIKYIT
jgi:hypothetical protein